MNLYVPLVIGLSLFDLQTNAPVVKIDGFEVVPENDEIALMKAVSNQPVSVAIDASGSDMQFYSEVKHSVPRFSVSLMSLLFDFIQYSVTPIPSRVYRLGGLLLYT